MAKWLSSWFSSHTESSANSSSLPGGVTKINDSLYSLYSPPGIAEVEIIFFHGLQAGDYKDAYWKTWSSDGNIWPQTLLAVQLPKARVLSVSYDSCARKGATGGRMDLYQIGENFVGDIITSNFASVGRVCPVILVGHSLGGLVIKEFLMRADEMGKRAGEMHRDTTQKIKNFVDKVSGIFYYSTPHGGSRLADLVERVPGANHDVLRFLKTLSKQSARLNNNFREWRRDNEIPAYSIGESLPTTIWGVSFIVVEEAAARKDTDDMHTAAADHISVCKPVNSNDDTFEKLVQFIVESIKKKGQTLTENPPAEESQSLV